MFKLLFQLVKFERNLVLKLVYVMPSLNLQHFASALVSFLNLSDPRVQLLDHVLQFEHPFVLNGFALPKVALGLANVYHKQLKQFLYRKRDIIPAASG